MDLPDFRSCPSSVLAMARSHNGSLVFKEAKDDRTSKITLACDGLFRTLLFDNQTFFQPNSAKKSEEILPNQKINKWKLLMKLHSDIINKDFDGKLDIVEEI